jgi:decaprenyl-phosphate phosphoribosyltransferase
MKDYLKLIRPEQWVKNFFVFAPLFFGSAFLDRILFTNVVLAFICFSLAASSIYILNDFFDVKEDQQHPQKSKDL